MSKGKAFLSLLIKYNRNMKYTQIENKYEKLYNYIRIKSCTPTRIRRQMNATVILTTILTIYRKRWKTLRKESSVQLISSETTTVFYGRLDCRFMEKERIMEIKHHVFHKT